MAIFALDKVIETSPDVSPSPKVVPDGPQVYRAFNIQTLLIFAHVEIFPHDAAVLAT
jgi:hypothetical protein